MAIPEDYLREVRSQSWIRKLIFPSDEGKLVLQSVVPLSSSEFFSLVARDIRGNAEDERFAVVYVHGFRTTFEEAARRAAAIGYQMKVPTMAFYSWPSKGSVAGYLADKSAVEASSDQLADFLIRFTRHSGAKKVHLIAHSMGNYALITAMFRPAMQRALASGLRFGQIILAAPDVDVRLFERDAPNYAKVADRVTVYASKGDVALTASNKLAEFPRAGLLPPVTVVPGIDTVDVSSVNLTLLGHAYVADEVAVLEDMNKLIFHNDAPAVRTRIQRSGDGHYWLLH